MDANKIEIIENHENIINGFNNFIVSSDTKLFGKMLARCLLLDKVKNIPGDIVECGVFKGSGLFTFLKLKRYMCPNSHKKVIGFDIFDTNKLLSNLNTQDKDAMGTLFNSRNYSHTDEFYNEFNKYIKECGFQDYEFELVKGNISQTSKDYIKDKPGFRISFLYMDLDLEEPTYDTLNNFWDRLSKGGIIVFDEYAYQQWSEANGVDRFFKDKNITINSLNYICPTAYVIKE